MKKNYFVGFFKSFGILPVLLMSAILFEFVVAGTSSTWGFNYVSADLLKILPGVFLTVFVGLAILGLFDIKNEKINFVDYLRVSGFLGGAGAAAYIFTQTGLGLNVYVLGGSAVVLLAETIVRFVFGKYEGEVRGIKGYASAVAKKFNPVLLLILGVGIAIVTSLFADSVLPILTTLYLGVSVGLLLITLFAASLKKNDKATLFDCLMVILLITGLELTLVGFKGESTFVAFIITLFTLASILLRAASYEADEVKLSKFKANAYFGDLYSKYDVSWSFLVGFLVLVACYSCVKNDIGILLPLIGFNVTLPAINDYVLYGVAGVVVVLLILTIVFRGLGKKEIVLVDRVVNILLHFTALTASVLVSMLIDYDSVISAITNFSMEVLPSLVLLGALVVALILCLVFQIVRVCKYQKPELAQEAVATEALESEETEEAATEEAEAVEGEEVVEEPVTEEAQPEEVVYVDEDGNEISAEEVEGEEVVEEIIEEPVTEEVVEEPVTEEAQPEEVVYVDEDGNVINPDELSLDDLLGDDTEEAQEDDEFDAFLNSIPEGKEEAKSEEVTEDDEFAAFLDSIPGEKTGDAAPEEEYENVPVATASEDDENVEYDDLDAFLNSIPEKNTEESTEEVVEEAPAESDDFDEDAFLAALGDIPEGKESSAPAAEEEVVYVDEDGNIINPEDVEGLEETEDEEEDEEEEEELSEEEIAEAEAAERRKGIMVPEFQLVDENGEPKRIRRKFNQRMMFADYTTKEYYNEIKNYLLMYRAKGRNSSRCETFRYRGLVAKVALSGKSVKVMLAIDPTSLEGSKYHYKDVSAKKQYAEVPTMIKVRSPRGLKYFKELVDLMMAAREVKPKKNYEPVNFIPSLIPNGHSILATIGLSTDYLFDTMNPRSIPSEMPEGLEDYLPVIMGEPLPEDEDEQEASVYLDTLCNHFVDGNEITIDILKEMHIVTSGNTLRIKARGTLDRKLIIYAEAFDEDALKMLMCTNCTAVKIVR